MNNDITVDTKTYKLTAPDGSGVSRRIDASTGLNTPVSLTIHQREVKEAGKAYHLTTVRISEPVLLSSGELRDISVSDSCKVPKDAAVTYAIVEPLLDRLAAFIVAYKDDLFEQRLS